MFGSSRRPVLSSPWVVGAAVAGVLVLAGVTVAGPANAAPKPKTGPVVTPTPTTNLLQSSTHLLGSSASDWTSGSATLTDGSAATGTTGAVAVASNGTGYGYAVATLGGATGPIKAVGGQIYTAGVSLQASGASRPMTPYLIFYSSTGSQLISVPGQTVTDPVGSWDAMQPLVAVAPTGAAFAALQLVWQAPVVGEAHYVSNPSLTTRASGSRKVVGPLHTVGNQIYDANGPIVLRGLHRFGFEGSVNQLGVPSNFTQVEINHAKAWGANMIRLSLAAPFWLSTNCKYDPTYATRVDQAVQWITSAGMVALVDNHWNSISDCSPVGAQLMADQRGATFMTALANRYKSNPLVMFDLYNEPHDISDAVWLNGGQVTSGGTTWTATGMQALYNAVRSTGATNVVIASGNNWANTLPSTLLVGTNIAYGVHVYTCPNSPYGADCQPNPLDPSPMLSSWVTPSATVPVVISEFGWPAKDDGRYVRNVISFAEGHGWSGWVAFAWDGGTQGTFDLLADTGLNYEPNATGMPVVDGFGKN